MYRQSKRLRIAVIGTRASGKSYLLYDMIHAFTLLGYMPEELPLTYPHSSFGAYFYDTFNSETGGMRGTESYACRPESHYGAYLSKHQYGQRLEVDFLNIPGEAFDPDSQRLNLFFDLLRLIERKKEGLFFLSEWKSPSGHLIKMIVPPDFNFNELTMLQPSTLSRYGNYMNWQNIRYELRMGQYSETERKSVTGKYVIQNLSEILTDSVLLTIEACWNQLTTLQKLSLSDCQANRVLHYFYPLVYTIQATDIIICDKLTDEGNTGRLSETMSALLEKKSSASPHVFLAFRCADLIWKGVNGQSQKDIAQAIATNLSERNRVYDTFLDHVQTTLTGCESQLTVTRQDSGQSLTIQLDTDDWRRHVMQSVGDGVGHAFWHLLNTVSDDGFLKKVMQKINKQKTIFELSNEPRNVLPPHVYFTATPIDASCRVYVNDPHDVTRFYCDEGNRLRSFVQEITKEPTQHMCFGSYQLLTDILYQNGIKTEGMQNRSELLKYMQNKY